MGKSNKVCPNCGCKLRQQFIGLQHCQCGVSWSKELGFFERTTDMKFCLERRKVGKKVKQFPVIRYMENVESKPVGGPKQNLDLEPDFDIWEEDLFQ